MDTKRWLLYGANGYSGKLLADEAVRRGHKPVLGGRSEEKIKPLAQQYGLEYRIGDIRDSDSLGRMLDGVDVVLNAAGPFINTALPLMRACIDKGVNYLDITGEIRVFEKSYSFDKQAREKGIAIISGVGFDVVPTDCLAVHTAGRVRNPVRLEIAFSGLGSLSPGTVKTFIRGMRAGILVRRNGHLSRLTAPVRNQVQFADKTRYVMPISWGDLSSAYRSTGIPDITIYSAVSKFWSSLAPLLTPAAGKLLTIKTVHNAVHKWIDNYVHGPDETARLSGESHIWARAENMAKESAESWLSTAESYQLTAYAGVRSVERIFERAISGSFTPAQAFGKDFILELNDSIRWDMLDTDVNHRGSSLQRAA